MRYSHYTILILLLVSSSALFSQSGMRFPELSKKLEPYFAEELISDIRKELPENDNFSIWGWDVGDFSGDGYTDLALSVKFLRDKRKIVQVYLFTDTDGFLIKVAQFSYEYFELPLEIGVSIKENTCFVTKKRKQFDWVIKGYRFDNGALILLDNFETSRLNNFTYEKYRNYQNCESKESYINTKNNSVALESKFISIPSYERGRMVYFGFANSVSTAFPEFVFDGAFYHRGAEDASYRIKSNYDQENIYFTVDISDDQIIPTRCDTCLGDNIELWFDFYPYLYGKNRLIKDINSSKLSLRSEADTGIYSITISPGDFMDRAPFVCGVKSTDEVNEDQKLAVSKIRLLTSVNRTGYQLKIKIPLEVFGISIEPITMNSEIIIGFTLVVNDVDNEFRSEEITRLSTSQFYNSNPSSFGELVLIPNGAWYGESYNVFHDEIIGILNENGF